MITRAAIKDQLRGSLEVIIATFAVIAGVILSVALVAATIGTNTVDIMNENYSPRGVFNLGFPDIFWVLLVLAILSFAVKFSVSLCSRCNNAISWNSKLYRPTYRTIWNTWSH